MRAQARPKNPKKRPPDPRDPHVQTLLYYAQSDWTKRRHRKNARYEQAANYVDLVADVVVRDGGYKCLCCGSRRWLQLDHIRPVSKGGKTELENLQLLCSKCNEVKADQIIDYRPDAKQGRKK